jgi:spermidine synthase
VDSDKLNNSANKSSLIELFAISLISLYFELVIIRWLSSEIRIFAYFKNVPLMACLFGLGLGMAMATNPRNLVKWFPLTLLIITTLICFAGPLHLIHVSFLNPVEHYVIGDMAPRGGIYDTIWGKLALFVPGLIVLAAVFYLIVFTFMSIGQRLGQLFNNFKPLTAYSINVGASLLGILLFSLVSFLSLTPPIWLLIGILACIWYYRKPWQIGALVASLAIAFATANPNVIWSPYYRISVDETAFKGDANHPDFRYGYNINVNYDAMEGCYNNNPSVLATLSQDQLKKTADYYDTPYIALGDKPRSILVLAAGTGNDVAAALRHGAIDVDALEIDPTIANIGKQLHPEHPYDNPNVHVIVDDARAFLRRTNKRYDLIVFAYLDSHSAFSSMSSLRLDNYVYTTESFQDACKLLKPNGVIACTFYYLNWWQLARVFQSFQNGTGEEPLGVFSPMRNGPTFLVGPGLDREHVKKSGLEIFALDHAAQEWKFDKQEWLQVCPTTDDWPFLFLRDRGLSWTYSVGILFTLMLGYKLVGKCFGKFSTDPTGLTMFFLGAAFMLIETKSVTQMGLLLGTTWIVNSAVISAVLLMILIANLVQLKCQFRRTDVCFGLLLASLILTYFLSLKSLNGLDPALRAAAGALLLSLPLIFAAIIFAITFSQVKHPDKALGMNLLGTLVGGALEYTSMMLGVNAMNLIAIFLYACAFYFIRKRTQDESNLVVEPVHST